MPGLLAWGMRRHALLFTLAMVLAGTIGVFVTEANTTTFNVVFLRCAVAAPLLGCMALLGRGLRSIARRELPLILAGGVALVANWFFLFKAFELASITIGIVAYYTAPFFLLAFGRAFLGERVAGRGWLATGIGFVGLFAITAGGGAGIRPEGSALWGLGAGVAAAVGYAGVTTIGKGVRETPPIVVAFLQVSVGALLLLPLADFGTGIAGARWGYLVVLGVVHTALLYALFFRSVRGVRVSLLAVLSFLEPVVAIATDVGFYGATLTAVQLLGVALVLGSSVAASRFRASERETRRPSAPGTAPRSP